MIRTLGFILLSACSLIFITREVRAMGRSHTTATATPTPVPNGQAGNAALPVPGASSCRSADPNHICIGLKLISYEANGTPVLTETQAITLVEQMNTIWGQCNISYQLETFQRVDPSAFGLNYDSNWRSDGDTIRQTFNDSQTFLVVTVGKLSGPTIGVTQMPGFGIYGSLIEDAYAQNAMTVGHELGHYQGLYHVSGSDNLMYAYIGAHTATLTADQCATARATDLADWKAMLRY
jgi:hypothetical protein